MNPAGPIESEVPDCLFKPSSDVCFQHLTAEVGGDVTFTEDANPSHMPNQTVCYVMMSPLCRADQLTKVGHNPELPIQKTLR